MLIVFYFPCANLYLGKYIPPHLRRELAAKEAAREAEREERDSGRNFRKPFMDSHNQRQRNGGSYYSDDYYNRNSNSNYSYQNGSSYNTQDYNRPRMDTRGGGSGRWDNLVSEPQPQRTYQPRRRAAETNRLGFHGSLYPNRYLEEELFNSSEHVTEGINFDNVHFLS